MSAAAARKSAFVLGVAYLLVGVLGFVPGASRPTERPGQDLLLGVFAVNGSLNVVHLAAGAGLVAAVAIHAVLEAPSTSSALLWMLAIGFALLVPAGLVAPIVEVLPLNPPATLLHAFSALFVAYLARSAGRRGAAR